MSDKHNVVKGEIERKSIVSSETVSVGASAANSTGACAGCRNRAVCEQLKLKLAFKPQDVAAADEGAENK